MHPRIVLLALASVVTDLLCLAGVGAVLLSNNTWIIDIGVARFGLVVMLIGIALVPMMYMREREAVADRLGRMTETAPRPRRTSWAGVEGSVRTA